nr:MAG TPA: hypothetical protein [Caudoviricetes sp.]
MTHWRLFISMLFKASETLQTAAFRTRQHSGFFMRKIQ